MPLPTSSEPTNRIVLNFERGTRCSQGYSQSAQIVVDYTKKSIIKGIAIRLFDLNDWTPVQKKYIELNKSMRESIRSELSVDIQALTFSLPEEVDPTPLGPLTQRHFTMLQILRGAHAQMLLDEIAIQSQFIQELK